MWRNSLQKIATSKGWLALDKTRVRNRMKACRPNLHYLHSIGERKRRLGRLSAEQLAPSTQTIKSF